MCDSVYISRLTYWLWLELFHRLSIIWLTGDFNTFYCSAKRIRRVYTLHFVYRRSSTTTVGPWLLAFPSSRTPTQTSCLRSFRSFTTRSFNPAITSSARAVWERRCSSYRKVLSTSWQRTEKSRRVCPTDRTSEVCTGQLTSIFGRLLFSSLRLRNDFFSAFSLLSCMLEVKLLKRFCQATLWLIENEKAVVG